MTRSRPRSIRPRALAASVAVLCLTLGACGARLTPEQRSAAIADGQNRAGSDGSAADASSGGVSGGTTGGSSSGGTTGGSTGGTSGGTSGGQSSTGGTSGGSSGGRSSTGGSSGGGNSGSGNGPGADSCVGTASGGSAPGVTASVISLGNSSDLSGPIGGLFASARDATAAYVKYFDATHPQGICGRQLKLDAYDSQTADSGDNQGTIAACQADFAMVGSVSAFDSGGAAAAAQCGIPDLRAVSTTRARQTCPVCFGTDSQQLPLVPQAQPDFWKKQFPGAPQKAAFVYVDTPTTAQQAKSWEAASAKDGFTWVVTQPIGVSESDYTPYVVKLQQAGAQYVQFLGAYQEAATLAQAMQQQGFTPKAFVLDPTGYSPDYIAQAGSAASGTYVFSNAAMLEESGSNAEMQTYIKWLHVVAPGAAPTYFGMFAWSSAELFVRLANQIGPNLTRPAMIAALKNVHNYTGNGLFAPEDVGGKQTSPCALFMQWQGSAWKRVAPGSGWSCGPNIDSGVD